MYGSVPVENETKNRAAHYETPSKQNYTFSIIFGAACLVSLGVVVSYNNNISNFITFTEVESHDDGVIEGSLEDILEFNSSLVDATMRHDDDALVSVTFSDDLGGIESMEEWLEVTTATNSKPHIVFILADDLGWNSIGYKDYDLSFATPVLTNLAKQGIIMDNYYTQEMCSPSRAALMTGRYPLSVGMQYHMIEETLAIGLNLNETTFPEVLQANGYSTHMVGKWDLGHYSPRHLPTARGFDSFTGYLNGENYYWSKRNPFFTGFIDMVTSNDTCYLPYEEDDLHTYSTFFYRDKAISIINDHDAEQSSLFLYISLQAVHNPFSDDDKFSSGIPKEYLDEDIYDQIHSEVDVRIYIF